MSDRRSLSDAELRDWFAGQALAGALAHHMSECYSKNDIAKQAYGMADAMLAARKGAPQAGADSQEGE